MPPKKPQQLPPHLEQPPDWQQQELGEDTPRSAQDEYPLVWVYGVNDHLDIPKTLPLEFQPTGIVSLDFRNLCQAIGASPHPAFKERKGPEKPVVRSRRPSLLNPGPAMEEPEAPKESPVFAVRSILVDSMTMNLFSLLLTYASCLKVICFSDCRLDSEMLGLLNRGLQGDCSVESLQIEWNPFELPLQSHNQDAKSPPVADPSIQNSRRPSHASGAPPPPVDPTSNTPGAGSRCSAEDLEQKERLRYLAQSQRHLRSFREHVESRFGGQLEDAWSRLLTGDIGLDTLLSISDFLEAIETRLGITGPQVTEVFEVLDGPDYAAGQGRVSLRELRESLESLPEAPADPDLNDPIGLALAAFVDGECILESLSLRACSIGRLELGPISAALERCPWQLRCLNLWDNRICDRGAALLGAALMAYRGLEYVGLGKNRLTQAGMVSVVKPFQIEVLDEAKYQDMLEGRTGQDGKAAANPKAKAAANPKAKADARRNSQAGSRRMSAVKGQGGRLKREAPNTQEEIEEVPGDPPSYLLRRPCEIRTLTLSDNPISGAEVVEALQPHGPRGAELVLRGTPVAAALAQLIAKRPDLASKPTRPPVGLAAIGGPPIQPPGEGWVLRVV